jgi:hypothetical protein
MTLKIRFADREDGARSSTRSTQANRFAHVITIVVGDHGEGLMQHGTMQPRAVALRRADAGSLRVPLAERPETAADHRGARERSRTWLRPYSELAGLARPPEFQGRSLAGVIRGEESADPERSSSANGATTTRRCLQGVRVVGEQFRTAIWPLEVHRGAPARAPLSCSIWRPIRMSTGTSSSERGEQASELARVLARVGRRVRAAGPAESVSPEDVEKLRALGYVP